MHVRFRALLALLTALLLLLSACGGGGDDGGADDDDGTQGAVTDEDEGDPVTGGELNVGVESETNSYAPHTR
jgi:peptide/nickel transport system substrate-binding protein